MASSFLDLAVQIALLLLSVSFLLTVLKVIKGPTLPDRVLALDMLVAVAIGFIAVIGIKTGFTLYLDIAIALGLVGFLTTVAFARFILARGVSEEERLEIRDSADDAVELAEIKKVVKKKNKPKAPAARNTAKRRTKTSKAKS